MNSGDSTELAPGRIAGVRWWTREEKSFNIAGEEEEEDLKLRFVTLSFLGKKTFESCGEAWRRRLVSKPFINPHDAKSQLYRNRDDQTVSFRVGLVH